MPAAVTERESLVGRILALPETDVLLVAQYVRSLERREPNASTAAAMRDVRSRVGLTAFDSVDDMFAALSEEADGEEYATA